MDKKYICKSDLLDILESKLECNDYVGNIVRKEDCDIVKNFPAADCVSRETFEQVAWERDLAISQLNEIRKGLGEKMDDIPMACDYKYRWHDLQKDANDLPETPNDSIHIKRYIVVYENGEQSMLMWAGGWNCCLNSDGTICRNSELTDVIAWREIEPFNSEVELR